MTIYQITRKSDGVDVYRYAADAPIAWDGMGFDTHTHTPMAQDVPATPQGPRRLTKLAFIGKIGSEFAGILTAAANVPGASLFRLPRVFQHLECRRMRKRRASSRSEAGASSTGTANSALAR